MFRISMIVLVCLAFVAGAATTSSAATTVSTATLSATTSASRLVTVQRLVIVASVDGTADLNSSAVFHFKLTNKGNVALRGIVLHLDSNVQPYGRASGHLVVDDPGTGALSWHARALKVDQTETLTVPVRLLKGIKLCAGTLLSVPTIQSVLHISVCFPGSAAV